MSALAQGSRVRAGVDVIAVCTNEVERLEASKPTLRSSLTGRITIPPCSEVHLLMENYIIKKQELGEP